MNRLAKRLRPEAGRSSSGPKDQVRGLAGDEKKAYERQRGRLHRPPLWYSKAAAREMGMHESMVEAFEALGAGPLLDMDYAAFPALTVEFLATLSSDAKGPVDKDKVIRFRLGNVSRELTLMELSNVMDFAYPEEYLCSLSRFPLGRFWYRISGITPLPRAAVRAVQIASPLLRLIVRVLGNTIYARTENSKPTHRELACLYTMLHDCDKLNMTWEFLKHVDDLKTRDGEVWIGGMVTRIASYYNIDFDRYAELPPTYLDKAYLLNARVVSLDDNNALISVFGATNHKTRLTSSRMNMKLWRNWYKVWAGQPMAREARAVDFISDEAICTRDCDDSDHSEGEGDRAEEEYIRRRDAAIDAEFEGFEDLPDNQDVLMRDAGARSGSGIPFVPANAAEAAFIASGMTQAGFDQCAAGTSTGGYTPSFAELCTDFQRLRTDSADHWTVEDRRWESVEERWRTEAAHRTAREQLEDERWATQQLFMAKQEEQWRLEQASREAYATYMQQQ